MEQNCDAQYKHQLNWIHNKNKLYERKTAYQWNRVETFRWLQYKFHKKPINTHSSVTLGWSLSKNSDVDYSRCESEHWQILPVW